MIESRFYIEENESTEKRTQQKNDVKRKFGAKLSANTIDNGRENSVTPKKIVRVRRAVSSSKPKEKKNHTVLRSVSDEVVVFSPGTVGLQLEPNQLNPTNGCRIVRFVDGGPKNPGQARKSGKLKPGDLVKKVEANGVVGSSYDDIVEILKDSCATRTVTFQSVWHLSILESNAKSGVMRQSKLDKTPERPLTPNAHNLSSAKPNISTQKETSRKYETLLPPPFLLGSAHNQNEKDEKEEPDHDSRFDITLIQSPSQVALLPHVRTPLSHMARSPYVRTPPSYAALLPCASNPSYYGSNKDHTTIVDFGAHFATPPVLPPIPNGLVPNTSPRRNSGKLTPSRIIVSEGPKKERGKPTWLYNKPFSPSTSDVVAPMVSVQSYPSIFAVKELKRSSLFSPSSVRRLSKIDNRHDGRENSIVSRVLERLCTAVAPIVANSSGAGRLKSATVTLGENVNSHGSVGARNFSSSETKGLEYTKARVLQELRNIKIAKDVEDIVSQEVERTIEDIHVANTQHTAAKKERKLYADKNKRQETKILELEIENRNLEKQLKDLRAASEENIRLSTVQETLHRTMGKLQSKQKQVEEWQYKHGVFQERVVALQGELSCFREKEKSLVVELEMSRTMTKEMETRLLKVEASSTKSVEALQNDLVKREEELKTSQSLVSKLKEEGGNLLSYMDNLETGVNSLQKDNQELRWELDRTKKELSESKIETATIHESLLQNLENGATSVAVDLGDDKSEGENTGTFLEVPEKMDDSVSLNRAARCALLVFVIREKILEDQYSKNINKLAIHSNDLMLALERSYLKARLDDEELRKRDRQILTLKHDAEEMETTLHTVTELRNQEHDENFRHLLKVGIHIDPQSINSHHLISTMRRDKEVLHVALSKMERNLERCTSQFEQKLSLLHTGLQISMDSENVLKRKLDEAMEKLSRTAIKLRRIEEEKAENEASLQESEESLSQAVHVIKKVEADVVVKDSKLESAEAQIVALKENEDVLCAERMELCEKILGLEERLTESTENICKLRRACNSVEYQKVALETKLQTMTDLSVDMQTLVLEKEELQQNVRTLKDQLKKCRGELELANASNLLLQSDLMDLLGKSEEQTRRESSTKEQLRLEVSHEKKRRHVLQQEVLDTAPVLESLKKKSFALRVAFLASVGVANAKTQCLLHVNKNLERLINEKTRDTKALEQQIISSQIQVEKLRGERQSLRGEILELKHRRAAETQDSKREIEGLEEALESSKIKHRTTRHNLQKAHDMLTGVSAQRDTLQSQISNALQREEMYNKEVRNVRREVSLLRSSVRKAQFKYCAASAAIEGMNRFSSQTVEDEVEKTSQVVSLTDQICNIEDELRCIEDNYELENRLLLKTIDGHKRMICALVAGSIAEHFRLRENHAQVGDKNGATLKLQTELEYVRSKLLLAESDLRGFLAQGNENDGLKKKLQELENRIGGLENECDSKAEEISTLRVCIAVEKDKNFRNMQTFEAERNRLSVTVLEMAQGISTMKEDIEDIQEEHINEFEGMKILLEDLRCTLEVSKTDIFSENQQNLTYKRDFDSLQRSLSALHSEKLVRDATIGQLEKKIMELVENMSTCQKESSEWRSKAKFLESRVQAMTKEYDKKVHEIVSLYDTNGTLLSRLSKSGDKIALLERRQKSSNSDLESYANIIAKAEEEREKALLERDEANKQVDMLQNTAAQLMEKVETLNREKHRLLSNRCIAEAALAGIRQQTNQGTRCLNSTKALSICVGNTEGPCANRTSMHSVESITSDQRPCLQDKTTIWDTGIINCATREKSPDAASDECTARNFEVSTTINRETSSYKLPNRIGDERIVGARLLSHVVTQRTRAGVGGAFRKWSCANNAMKATSQLHRNSKELSHQLHCTREKLLVLKSHIRANSTEAKDNEPRLRMVLKPLTDHQRLIDPSATLNL